MINIQTGQYALYDEKTNGFYVSKETSKGLLASTELDTSNNEDKKEAYVGSVFFQMDAGFTKEDYLSLYDTKQITISGLTYEVEIRIDDDGHFTELKLNMEENGIGMELRVNYTWDESINIEYPNIHIHNKDCIGYEQIDDTYHYVIENNCGYESSNRISEEHKLDANGKCVCGYEKEEELELTDEEKYAKVYNEIYNGDAYYDMYATITNPSGGSNMNIDSKIAGMDLYSRDMSIEYGNYYFYDGLKQITSYIYEAEYQKKYIQI